MSVVEANLGHDVHAHDEHEHHEASCLSEPQDIMSPCSSLLSSPDEKFIRECLDEENLDTDVWFFTQ